MYCDHGIFVETPMWFMVDGSYYHHFLLFSFKFKYQETFPSVLSYLSLPVIFVIIH